MSNLFPELHSKLHRFFDRKKLRPLIFCTLLNIPLIVRVFITEAKTLLNNLPEIQEISKQSERSIQVCIFSLKTVDIL